MCFKTISSSQFSLILLILTSNLQLFLCFETFGLPASDLCATLEIEIEAENNRSVLGGCKDWKSDGKLFYNCHRDNTCSWLCGWVECVGCADRSAYDLTQHTKSTGIRLAAEKKLQEPKIIDIAEAIPNKAAIGKAFKKEGKLIIDTLAALSVEDLEYLEKQLEKEGIYDLPTSNNKSFTLKKDMIEVKRFKKTIHVEDIIPSVIEPSFGVGRIMYAIFEHNFKTRENDEQRTYISLPALVAPIKCSILPLSSNSEFQPFIKQLSARLKKVDVSHKVDDSSGSIGRRYARTDEIAIPYGITIDFDSLKEPHSVTLRERDSMGQVRIPLDDIAQVIHDLSYNKFSWQDVERKYPKFEQQENKGN